MHTIFSIDFPIAIIDGGDNFEIFEYGGEEGKQTNEKLEKSVKSYVRLSVRNVCANFLGPPQNQSEVC